MQHSHLNQNLSYSLESRVGLTKNVQTVAHAALKNIPGATEIVQNYFNPSYEQKEIPRPEIKNQVQHLGFGTPAVY